MKSPSQVQFYPITLNISNNNSHEFNHPNFSQYIHERLNSQNSKETLGNNQKRQIQNEKSLMSKEEEQKSTQNSCPVCLSQGQDVSLNSFGSCNHIFCQDCISRHIIQNLKNWTVAKCLQQKCPQILSSESHYILSLSHVGQERYKKIMSMEMVSRDPSLRCCLNEHCPGVININDRIGVCSICKLRVCSKCLIIEHEGQCDENGTEFLQRKFKFKKCSRCNIMTEKIRGCNHISCKCGHQFCYACGDNWSQDHYCEQGEDDGQQQDQIDIQLFIQLLRWYLTRSQQQEQGREDREIQRQQIERSRIQANQDRSQVDQSLSNSQQVVVNSVPNSIQKPKEAIISLEESNLNIQPVQNVSPQRPPIVQQDYMNIVNQLSALNYCLITLAFIIATPLDLLILIASICLPFYLIVTNLLRSIVFGLLDFVRSSFWAIILLNVFLLSICILSRFFQIAQCINYQLFWNKLFFPITRTILFKIQEFKKL